MVFGLRPVPDSDFRPFQADLDTRKLLPMYRALGTKSIVMKINGRAGFLFGHSKKKSKRKKLKTQEKTQNSS